MTKEKSTVKAAKRTPGSPATAPRRTPGAWTKHSAAALESVQANIFVADTDFVIVYANPSAKETLRKLSADFQTSFAIDVENLVGHSIHRFHRDPQRVESILRDPAALPHQTEFAFGGVTLQARINAVRDDGDRVVSYVVAWEDVTERRRLELDSAGQIAAMRRVQAVIEFKLDGSIVDANDCFLKAMGYELDEIKGRHHRLFVDPKEAGSEKYRQFWLDLAEGKRKFGRFRRLGKSGQEVWIEGSYFPILDASGKPFKVVKYATDVTQLKNVETSLESTAQTLASAGHELTAVSQQMASNSEETAAQASVVSAAAEQVSRNVESVAGAVEEMGASIKEIAKNANDAARVATSAVKIAEKTNSTVSKLGESSAEIGAVIKVITSIAQQTNLLALNATIEAARAGDAGKGFAVVANEVKELAKQTAKATEDIGRKIEAIQSDTKGAVDAIAQIGAVIGQINDIQTAIAGAVEQQTATTSEIARNVSEAALGSREIAENVTAVAQAARETTEGAANTKTSADELSRLASELLRLIATLQG